MCQIVFRIRTSVRAKAKKRSRKRSNLKAKAQYAEKNHALFLNDVLLDERRKADYEAYGQKMEEAEEGILSRAVIISQVKNLRDERNLLLLRQFLSDTYGPLDSIQCFVRSGGRQWRDFPLARVRFVSRKDAEKIFGGVPRSKVAAKDVYIPCTTVGYKREIRVKPQTSYSNVKDPNLSGPIVSIDATALALGHWCPREPEICQGLIPEENDTAAEQWLEEAIWLMNVTVALRLKERQVEMVHNDVASSLSKVCGATCPIVMRWGPTVSCLL